MKHWLESLAENGFDVFTVVYIAVLGILYHYLMRWFIDVRLKKLENKIEIQNELLHHIIDEVEEWNVLPVDLTGEEIIITVKKY